MAITLGNHFVQESASSVNSYTTTSNLNGSGATLLIIIAYWLSAKTGNPTVTDSSNNTYQKLTTYGTGGTSGQGAIYYCLNPTVTASMTAKITGNGTDADFWMLNMIAFNGVGSYQAAAITGFEVDGSSQNNQVGSLTPNVTGALFITGVNGYENNGGTFTITLSFSTIDTLAGGSMNYQSAYLIGTDTTSKNPTWTTGNDYYSASTMAIFLPGSPITGLLIYLKRGEV